MNILYKSGNFLFNHLHAIYFSLYKIYKKISDYRERKIIAHYLRPGGIAVDIGANIGTYTSFLAEIVGKSGMVHAFEPSADNFTRLEKNTRKFKNVRLNRKAVGSGNGKIQLFLSKDLNVDHRTYPTGEARAVVDIDSVTLDNYFSETDMKVDFIKMDIQGFEYHALLGMKELCGKNRDIKILLEFWPAGMRAAGVNPERLSDMLIADGFHLYVITTKGLVSFNRDLALIRTERYFNVLASRMPLQHLHESK